ncbi:MAG TPA: M64 family metallopeptidase, partial [Planctomycetota bacterium]|nr:M64 family metallopeptidase [Planctomycetota bacterium]
MKLLPVALFLLLVPRQDSAEKAIEKLYDFMNRGAFVEGRGLAVQICQKFPNTPAATAALPYTRDNAFLTMSLIEANGPPKNRIDLVVMADGLEYDNREQERWKKESDLIFKGLFEAETLKEYAKYFNTYRAHIASKASKLNKPDGPVLTFFKSRDDDGEILTDGFAARDIAAQTGVQDKLALVQVRPAGLLHGISGHGVATFGSPRPGAKDVLHAFGHAIAGLADESPSLKVYGGMEKKKREPPPIPVAANVSDTRDALKIPWAHWLKAKEEGDKRASKIDIHEGAAFRAMKAWRPVDESLCVMNDGQDFCPVCRETVVLLLYSYVRPIDAALPCDKV